MSSSTLSMENYREIRKTQDEKEEEKKRIGAEKIDQLDCQRWIGKCMVGSLDYEKVVFADIFANIL